MKIGPLEISFKLQPLVAPVSPMQEAGLTGTEVYGGFVVERERDRTLVGNRKYETYADLMVNTSVVAAGIRYFTNLVAKSAWKVLPADDTPEAKAAAEFMQSVFEDIDDPWPRIVRRASAFRFYGFGVHEWTAKIRPDGRIGIKSLNQRPQFTIQQWNVDPHGHVIGMWQNAFSNGFQSIYIPRAKTVYLLDDSMTDSPEGLGVFRHLVEPYQRLNKYLKLEGRGYERDLNGIPIGKVPYTALSNAVKAGVFTKDQADGFVKALEDFVTMEAKGTATGLVLDSQPFESLGDNGRSVSSIQQWGIELLKGGSQAHTAVASAIDRTNHEMARIIGTEGLMLGADGAGSLALSRDKSLSLLLQANSTLIDLREGMSEDLIGAVWMLNGLPDELRPHFGTEEIQQKDAVAIANALKLMGDAGATMAPDDPAVDDVRDILGVAQLPEDIAARMVKENAAKPAPKPAPAPALAAGATGG